MRNNIPKTAFDLIKPIAEGMGYVLVEVQFRKEHSGNVLAVCIDKEGGVNINDCEKLSKAIDKPLDDADISRGVPYYLNVSSYGLDRSIKTEYDYNKHLEKEVILKFYKPFLAVKSMIAVLKSYDDETVTVNYKNEELKIKKSDIANMTINIKF